MKTPVREQRLQARYPDAGILIVDDEEGNAEVLKQMLKRSGYENLRCTTDARNVLRACRKQLPEVLVLDLHMPHTNGLELMGQLRAELGRDLPEILVLTGDTTQAAKARALTSGARDFLHKPVETTELLIRIHNLIDLHRMHRALRDQNILLEQRVDERTRELNQARLDVIARLGMAGEFRDDATGQHTRRVGWNSAVLAHAIGQPPEFVELVARGAPLHDVGKIAIPDHILLKPGRLTDEETAIMRTHAEIGARMLSDSDSPLLLAAREIALNHHERWDGTGYPNGLRGTDIPLAGRIVALADVFDALTHNRPYRALFPLDHVIDTIAAERGRHFDPELATAFLDVIPRITTEPADNLY